MPLVAAAVEILLDDASNNAPNSRMQPALASFNDVLRTIFKVSQSKYTLNRKVESVFSFSSL